MDPVFKAYLELFESLHEGCQAQIAGLTEEQLDWRPADGMNSLAVLAAHVAGAERYWIGDVVMGEPSGRVRDKEFATTDASEEALAGLLAAALEYVRVAFGRLTADQLAEVRTSSPDGHEYTVAWSIAHALEHIALHLGHMQITREWLASR